MLNKIDKLILMELQRDASQSSAEIAAKVGSSQTVCWRRIQKLENEGYIKKRVALLDPEKLGLGTIVFAHIKLSAHGRANLDQFSKEIRNISRVVECYCLMGDQDFYAKVLVKDVFDYERLFFDKLSKIPGVAEVKSTMALSHIKNTTELPIE
jgi:Lrp/AsnC family transcriptional regulator